MKKIITILLICLQVAAFGQTTKKLTTDTIRAKTDTIRVVSPMESDAVIEAPLYKQVNDTLAPKSYVRYLIGLISETDPIFSASVAFNIKASDTTRWSTAYTASNGLKIEGNDVQLGGRSSGDIQITSPGHDALTFGHSTPSVDSAWNSFSFHATNGSVLNNTTIDYTGIKIGADTSLHASNSAVQYDQMRREILAYSKLSVSATASTFLNNTVTSVWLTAYSNDVNATYTWYYPDRSTSIGTGKNKAVVNAGLYWVVAESSSGCTDSASVYVYKFLGTINELNVSSSGNITTGISIPIIQTGTDTTGTTPTKKGNIFVDNSGNIYISKNTSRGGWVKLMYLIPFTILICRKFLKSKIV